MTQWFNSVFHQPNEWYIRFNHDASISKENNSEVFRKKYEGLSTFQILLISIYFIQVCYLFNFYIFLFYFILFILFIIFLVQIINFIYIYLIYFLFFYFQFHSKLYNIRMMKVSQVPNNNVLCQFLINCSITAPKLSHLTLFLLIKVRQHLVMCYMHYIVTLRS